MRRIASPQGKTVAGIAWLAAVVVIAAIGLSSDGPPWVAIGVGIGAASLVLGRLTGAFALAAPAAAILPLAAWFWAGSGEYSEVFALLALGALACAEAGAAIGLWWYAWSWSGTLTRTR
jgi:hypothetical protein